MLMSKCNPSSTAEFLNLGLLFSVTAPEIRPELDSRNPPWYGCPEHQVLLMAQVLQEKAFLSDAFTPYKRGNQEKQQDFCGIYCVSVRASRQGECQGHIRVPGTTDGGEGSVPTDLHCRSAPGCLTTYSDIFLSIPFILCHKPWQDDSQLWSCFLMFHLVFLLP